MKFLGYAYRFASNFVFLAAVYYSLNLLEKYPQRAVLAVLILIYAGMHAASALRAFHFFQRIERLEAKRGGWRRSRRRGRMRRPRASRSSATSPSCATPAR